MRTKPGMMARDITADIGCSETKGGSVDVEAYDRNTMKESTQRRACCC